MNAQATAIRTFRVGMAQFTSALRAFLRGFVGETTLPHERHAVRHELAHRANGRGRCC